MSASQEILIRDLLNREAFLLQKIGVLWESYGSLMGVLWESYGSLVEARNLWGRDEAVAARASVRVRLRLRVVLRVECLEHSHHPAAVRAS